MVKRCACILLSEYRARQNYPPEAVTVTEICQSGLFGLDSEEVAKTIRHMITAGSRYRNLENHLGDGVCLVLGMVLKESSWCQVLPKSGEKFERVMQHLHRTPVVRLAREYGELRHHIVNHQLCFLGLHGDEASEITPTANQDWDRRPSWLGEGDVFHESRTIGEFDFDDSMWFMTERI